MDAPEIDWKKYPRELFKRKYPETYAQIELLIELRKEFLKESLEIHNTGILQAVSLIEQRLEAMGVHDYVTA